MDISFENTVARMFSAVLELSDRTGEKGLELGLSGVVEAGLSSRIVGVDIGLLEGKKGGVFGLLMVSGGVCFTLSFIFKKFNFLSSLQVS